MSIRSTLLLPALLGLAPVASGQGSGGPEWVPFTGPASGLGTGASAFSSLIWDDGTGPALYLGGWFPYAGSLSVQGVAKWDGMRWSRLGDEAAFFFALTVFDDGTGPTLWGGSEGFVEKWDGAHWTTVGTLNPDNGDIIYALASFDDGSGPALYAGGQFARRMSASL